MNKQQRNNRRKHKTAVYKQKRREKVRNQKHFKKEIKQEFKTKKVDTGKQKLTERIRMWFLKLKCRLGFHKWVLMSGRPGMHKYFCPICSKLSDEVWEEKDEISKR